MSQFKVIANLFVWCSQCIEVKFVIVVARVLIVAVRRRVVLVKVIDLMVVSSNSCDGGGQRCDVVLDI